MKADMAEIAQESVPLLLLPMVLVVKTHDGHNHLSHMN
jgi:hypothetical protein